MMSRRLMDIVGSSIFLLFATPIFLVTSLAIWLTDGDGVFYRQTRVGLRGRPFELLKFRSMRSTVCRSMTLQKFRKASLGDAGWPVDSPLQD